MLTRLRFWLESRQIAVDFVIYILVIALIVIGLPIANITQADDSRSQIDNRPAMPERMGEEVDIFRERQKELARQEKKEAMANAKKKSKTPPTVANWFTLTPIAPADVSDGAGMIGQGGHLIGKTFGRSASITPLELMPYILTDEHFIFADLRGFVTNRSEAGGNAGIGYRHLREDLNAWAGASLWYDADQSSSKLFQQIGLSFEGLIQRFELRSNVYLPVTSSQTISNKISNAAIVGNQLLYGRAIDVGTALNGVDGEFGYSLPVLEKHVVRGFVGGYHFDGGGNGGVNGFKARIEGVYNNTITAQALYTHDKLYGDNVMVGVSLQFPFANNHPTAGWRKNTPSPFRFVERNYNVIVSQSNSNLGNQVAVNPTTGLAYNVEQVNIPATGSAHDSVVASGTPGSSTNPFNTIAAAQAAGGDLIIVQNGSVITENVTLTAGQHLLGQGSYLETLPVTGGGSVQIPNLLLASQQTATTQTPVFETATGPAVTLASNSEVAGFLFSNTGSGIAGSNVMNASLHDLKFLTTGGDAIHLTNSSGSITLNNIQINAATGNGVVFDGGTANINYFGSGNSISAQGNGFVLENLTGGKVGLSSLTVKSPGGIGLQLSNVATSVTVDSLNVSKSTGSAVSISGNTGTQQIINGTQTNVYNTYNFTGNTVITSPNGAGYTVNGTDAIINVANLNVTSTSALPAVSLVNATDAVTFGNLTLNTANATGLYGVGLSDLLQINGGSITTVGAPAINVQSSTINAVLAYVSVNGGPYGIGLAQSTGNLTIQGNGSYATGGTIQNTQSGVMINSFGNANLNWIDFVSNGTAIQSTKSSQLNLQNIRVSSSTGYAINSLDDSTLLVSNSIFTTNGGLNGGTILIQADTVGTFQSRLASNNITDANGTAIQYLTQPSGAHASLAATIQSNTILGYRGSSPIIGVNWSGPASLAVSNNSIYAYGSSMTGVRIQDTSTTDSLSAKVNNNTIVFEPGAAQGTGVSVLSGMTGQSSVGTSQLSVTQNNIDFKATGGIGTRYSLFGSTTTAIISNIITDESGGGTGMLFDNVAANSRIQIDGNTINLLASDLTVHQGIIFTSVTPTIQFIGSVNNLIYNTTSAQSLFSIPVNSATGGFYINGTLE